MSLRIVGGGEGAPSPYPAPKPQDLSLLARKIQRGEVNWVRAALASNPRLLASTTDGPPILQEGFRYNALHIAARAGNFELATHILATVNGLSFMRSLYPDDPQGVRNSRTRYLTDMYLNTPDKGALETPLHFACKFSFYEIIKLFLSHPLCDITIRNRDGKTAEEVIGSRGRPSENCENIRRLFVENKIVPIWRDPLNESQPVVGRPVDPKYLSNFTPSPFTKPYGDIVLEHFGPADMQLVPRVLFGSQKVIRAYAGPMDDETALQFYQSLKSTSAMGFSLNQTLTPPGSPMPGFRTPDKTLQNEQQSTPKRNPLLNSHKGPLQTSTPIQVTPPPRRRMERTPGTPYSAISKDLECTPTTLSLLLTSPRSYTPGKSPCVTMVEDKSIRLGDPNKGVERVAGKYAREQDIPWNEYWGFLDEFCDLCSKSGLELLENHLKRNIDLQELSRARDALMTLTPISRVCIELDKLALGSGKSPYIATARHKDFWKEDWRNRLGSTNSQILPVLENEIPIPRRKSEFMENLDLRRTSGDGEFSFAPTAPAKGKTSIKRLFPKLNDSLSSTDDSLSSTNNTFDQYGNESASDEDTDWSTAPSSPLTDEAEYGDCEAVSTFVNGTKPSNEDYQAYRALLPVIHNISVKDFPLIVGWFNALKASGDRFRRV